MSTRSPHSLGLTATIADQTILVTGASGFIGRHLTPELIAHGATVHAVARTPRPEAIAATQWWFGDLGDAVFTQQLFAAIKPTWVFHLASHVTGARDAALVGPTLHSNLLTTVHVLQAALDHGCQRVVLIGSMEEPVAVDTIPSSPYAAAKWASSNYGRMFHALYGLPVVIARIFMTYGPDQPDQHKLIPYVTCSLLQGNVPRLGSGTRLVDWIYIDDVMRGLIAIASTPGIEGNTVDLGSGTLVSIQAVVDQLAQLIGADVQPQFGVLTDRALEQSRCADTAKSWQQVQWQPQMLLTHGLVRTVAWYRAELRRAQQIANVNGDDKE